MITTQSILTTTQNTLANNQEHTSNHLGTTLYNLAAI